MSYNFCRHCLGSGIASYFEYPGHPLYRSYFCGYCDGIGREEE